jgi:hypothetical protein
MVVCERETQETWTAYWVNVVRFLMFQTNNTFFLSIYVRGFFIDKLDRRMQSEYEKLWKHTKHFATFFTVILPICDWSSRQQPQVLNTLKKSNHKFYDTTKSKIGI